MMAYQRPSFLFLSLQNFKKQNIIFTSLFILFSKSFILLISMVKNLTIIFLISLFLFSTAYAQDDHEDHLDQHDENENEHEQDHEAHNVQHLSQSQIWGFGFLAGFAISLIGFIAAIILLVVKKCCSLSCFNIIIKFLFSLALGALLGDAIIHIIAESYSNNSLNPLIISTILICSILGFIMIQKLMQSCGVSHTHWVGQQQHNQSSINPEQIQSNNEIGDSNKIQSKENIQQNMNEQEQGSNEKENKCKKYCKSYSGKGTTGYMNLLGSLIHNFIDGLALGVAFATGNPQEIVPVLVAIIAHQIPRELGDVAILLKNDFSQVQTVICNGSINMISLVGVLIGLAIVNANQVVKSYIMVFVAANFLYISADIWRHMFKNTGENKIGKNILQFIGFGVGVGAMYALTLFEGEQHNH